MSQLTVVIFVLAALFSLVSAIPSNKREVRGGSYVVLGDKEYFISDAAEEVDWNGAVAKCQALGMMLLSIETQEENSRIVQHCAENDCLSNYIWTSAVKNAPRDWSWSATGESIVFFDWAYRQPNNDDNETSIAVLPLEGWNDVVPTDLYTNYICE